jgi:hypothetical protein
MGLGTKSMKIGKHICHLSREFPFTLQEDTFLGNENIIKIKCCVIDEDTARNGMVEKISVRPEASKRGTIPYTTP